jgi:hypothetical protein
MKSKVSTNLKLLIFSYLPGPCIYHKIALLNQATRHSLPGSALLSQPKILKMRNIPKPKQLRFCLRIPNLVLNLIVTKENLDQISELVELLDLKNEYSEAKT